MIKLYNMDVLKALKQIPDESVDMQICSPPYWGLRDYGEGVEVIWDKEKDAFGNCEHDFNITKRKLHSGSTKEEWVKDMSRGIRKTAGEWETKDGFCKFCGAWKGQLGLEPNFELFIKHLTDVFDEVKRVLKKDGTCWINLGDTYSGSPSGLSTEKAEEWDKKGDGLFGRLHNLHTAERTQSPTPKPRPDIDPRLPARKRAREQVNTSLIQAKCLCAIPERFIIAMVDGIDKPNNVKNNEDRAWLGGIIDGEGCIGIRRSYPKGKSHYYVPYLRINSIDKELIQKICWITKCGKEPKIEEKYIQNDGYNRKKQWAFRIEGRKAGRILADVYKYLTIKKEQCKIACYLADKQENNKRMGKFLKEEELKERKYLFDLIKKYNQRETKEICDLPAPSQSRIGGGWILRNKIIWHKPNHMPTSVKDRFANSWEYLFMFVKNKKYYFDLDGVREPHKAGATRWGGNIMEVPKNQKEMQGQSKALLTEKRAWRNPKGKNPDDVIRFSSKEGNRSIIYGTKWSPKNREYNPLGKQPEDFWNITTRGYPDAHFAVFPEKLVERPIKTTPMQICKKCGKARERITKPTKEYSKLLNQSWTEDTDKSKKLRKEIGFQARTKKVATTYEAEMVGWTDCKCGVGFHPAVILDIFAGSGTTLAVARRLNRDAIGIEIKKEYCDLIKKRLYGENKPLFDEFEMVEEGK